MAEIIEGTPVEPGEDDVVVDLFADSVEDDVTGEQEVTTEQGEPEGDASAEDGDEDESVIPVKFKGKTKREIVQIYADLEREFGRRNNELGELRKLTDDILRKQLSPDKSDEGEGEEELTAQDFLNDPVTAVRKVLENDPERKRAKEDAIKSARDAALTRFKNDHPDAKDVMSNPAFIDWLQKVPARYQRFVAADSNLDWDTANETISTFKEVHAVAKQEADDQREGALRDVKNASPAAHKGGSKRKVIRKADIFKLKETNPARYEAMQESILQAYREGRVVD